MPNSTLNELNFTVLRRWLVWGGGLALVPLLGHAQGRAAVSGTIGNEAGAPQEFVTVTLHRAADSMVVKTEFTNAKGAFQLESAAGGRYLLSAAQVGCRRYWSPAFVLPAAGLALPDVRMLPSQGTVLKEVTVQGRRPLYEHLADRTVVHVAESPLAAGSTTLDVLGRAPSVTVDGTNNLALRGRQGVLVVVDGKRVPLTGNDLADYLRALPAEQIQSIELVTNPPASYDAQGGAGVIDIKLKRDQRLGTNGSLNASYGRGEYGKFIGGGTLNYRNKKLNLYGTYNYADRRYFTRFDINRQFFATAQSPAASSVQNSDQTSHLQSHSAKVGLDLNLSKRTLLGASVTGLASQINAGTNSHAQFYDAAGAPADRLSSTNLTDLSQPNGAANLNLRHAFADSATARVISADADLARYHTRRLTDLTTFYEMPTQAINVLNGNQRSDLTIGAAKVDYSQPLPHRTRLEAGLKSTYVKSDNDVAFVNNGVLDPTISSQFQYRENVNAAYASLRGALPRTTLQVGLRAEQTNVQADLSGARVRDQNYVQLFPNLLVQRTFNKSHALALAVARRIDRPSYLQVNPLRVYLDATSYREGTPGLLPSTSYSFELTHTFRQKFTTSLAYARTTQPIYNIIEPVSARVVRNRLVNLSNQNFYTLTLTAPLELAKWWTLYANAIVYYNQYQGTVDQTTTNRGLVSCNLTLNNSFTLPHGWTAELNGLYESRDVYGFQTIRPKGQVGAGLQRSLWNKQGTFRLSVTDIFYTTPIRATSTYDNFTDYYVQRQDLRVVTAALAYRFGNSKVAAARKRAAGADEELRRAGGGQ
ncbi:MAG: TonB-dependent receptor [Cytophagaceae bacterium]|nr:MAG: TonB-dependent receptor [Cytophagaceae bacterium]